MAKSPKVLSGQVAAITGDLATGIFALYLIVPLTLLGLWIIVVQTRHGEWRHSAVHRQRAHGVALHFSLPGAPRRPAWP